MILFLLSVWHAPAGTSLFVPRIACASSHEVHVKLPTRHLRASNVSLVAADDRCLVEDFVVVEDAILVEDIIMVDDVADVRPELSFSLSVPP